MGLFGTSGRRQVNISECFPFLAYQTLTSIDDPSPFARLHEASKPKVPTVHVMKGARARATTIPNPRKQPAVHLPSKREQAVRVAPTRMAGLTKKTRQTNPPTRPATATGRMATTLRTAPVSIPRIHARPATSASLRPPIAVTRTMKPPTKVQVGATPLVADPEIVLGYEGVEIGIDDFMFDV